MMLCENDLQLHSMAIAKLSETYEVEIPQEIREAMKLKPGDELVFVVRGTIASFMTYMDGTAGAAVPDSRR